ncbi:hypothetical protein C0J52_24727 [Blattella germanica]|nr:hypothetical protein C0J52_24727 [Blattella germanica]
MNSNNNDNNNSNNNSNNNNTLFIPVPLSWTPLQVGQIFIEPQVSKLEGFYCINIFL